jgi:hypothetical protein
MFRCAAAQELVQRHEALLRGVALMLETSPTGPQAPSAPPTPALPPAGMVTPAAFVPRVNTPFSSLDALTGSGGDAAHVMGASTMFDLLTVNTSATPPPPPQQQQQQPGEPLNLLH